MLAERRAETGAVRPEAGKPVVCLLQRLLWRTVALFLPLPVTWAQTRAAQLACRGRYAGEACSYLATKSGTSDSGSHSPGDRMRGRCYEVDRWRDGSGGAGDFAGVARLPAVAVCLEDGSYELPKDLKTEAVEGSENPQPSGGGAGASTPMTRPARSSLSIGTMISWIIDGGWKLLGVSCAAFAVMICTCTFVVARLMKEDNDEPSSFMAHMPVALGVLKVRMPWRAARATNFRQMKKRGAKHHQKPIPGSRAGPKAKAKAGSSTAQPKGKRPGKKGAEKAKAASQPAEAKQRQPDEEEHYDIEAELREAGLLEGDEAAAPTVHHVAEPPSAAHEQDIFYKARAPVRSMPRLNAPPTSLTPVPSPPPMPSPPGNTAGKLLVKGPAPPPRGVPEPSIDDAEENPGDIFNVPPDLDLLEEVVQHSARPHSARSQSRHSGGKRQAARKKEGLQIEVQSSGGSDSDDGERTPLSSHASRGTAAGSNPGPVLGLLAVPRRGGGSRKSAATKEKFSTGGPRSKWDAMEDDLCAALEEDDAAVAPLTAGNSSLPSPQCLGMPRGVGLQLPRSEGSTPQSNRRSQTNGMLRGAGLELPRSEASTPQSNRIIHLHELPRGAGLQLPSSEAGTPQSKRKSRTKRSSHTPEL